jgi:hypothetical protein
MMATNRRLLESDDSARIARDRHHGLYCTKQRDRRRQEGIVTDESRASRQDHLQSEQRHRGQPARGEQKDHQDQKLSGHVLDTRQRLRQVHLQRVGAAVAGDQPGTGIDRDEEQEQALLIEELSERARIRRQE